MRCIGQAHVYIFVGLNQTLNSDEYRSELSISPTRDSLSSLARYIQHGLPGGVFQDPLLMTCITSAH